MNNRLALALSLLLIQANLITTAQAITINPTFIDGSGYTWDSTKQGVIQQAINDWQTLLPDNHSIDVTFDFTYAGSSYLGQWQGGYSLYEGTDVYPWTSGVTHNVHFNTYFFTGTTSTWWDPTPTTSTDLTSNKWDALSVARHELGHLLGFTDQFYVDNFYTAQEFDKWGTHISGSTFDPGGLNVTMTSYADLSHVSNSGSTANDLMVTALPNGVRRGISVMDLSMLQLAYDYSIVLPVNPTTYTLTATTSKTRMHLGDNPTITATITNTGTGTVDTLDYSGLLAIASDGSINGSSKSGGPLAISGGSASNSGLTFTSTKTGTFTITPAVTSATNHTMATPATLATTTPATITVYSGQGVWNAAGTGSWLDVSNWSDAGGVPGIDGELSAYDTATFTNITSPTATVFLNGATPRLAELDLDAHANEFTIACSEGGSLTLQATTGNEARILGIRGKNSISAPVILGSDAWIGSIPGVTIDFPEGITGNYVLTVASSISVSSIRVDTLRIGTNFAADAVAVPEPSTLALLGFGAFFSILYAFRHRKMR